MENGVRPFVRPCVITCGNGAGTGIIEKLAAGPLLFLLLRYRASQLSYRTIPKRSAKNDSQLGGGVVGEGKWRESRLLAQFRSGHQIRNGRLIFARRRCGGRNIFHYISKNCGKDLWKIVNIWNRWKHTNSSTVFSSTCRLSFSERIPRKWSARARAR